MSAIPSPGLPDPGEVRPARNPFGRNASRPPEQEPQREPSRGHMAGRGDGGDPGQRRDRRPADSTDILLSIPTELAERLESVLAYTYPHTGIKTKQQFIRDAVRRACAEHEARFNDGDRWPPVPKPKTP
jgi:hypothetical protein